MEGSIAITSIVNLPSPHNFPPDHIFTLLDMWKLFFILKSFFKKNLRTTPQTT